VVIEINAHARRSTITHITALAGDMEVSASTEISQGKTRLNRVPRCCLETKKLP